MDWFGGPGRETAARRALIVAGLLTMVVSAHWLTPIDSVYLHSLHLVLRKMFLLPVILAAMWFGLRGSLLTAAAATAFYLPHIAYQWTGRLSENLNQMGEIGSLWLVAGIVGALASRQAEANRRALESHRGALVALVSAIDARERGTERHSLRVMAYAERLGRELFLSEAALQELKVAALLHDIGKISFTDEMLLGAGDIDGDERALVRDHPALGSGILHWVPSLSEVAKVVHCHHERHDGRGYPRGLRGTQIPLHARIIAIADTFDVLTSGRPYKPPVEVDDARRVIDSERGTQFDPVVAEAFARVPEEELEQIRDSQMDTPTAVSSAF